MDEISKRLFKWFNGLKAPPEMVQIYPTNKCNLECIFCTQRTRVYESEKEVRKERWFEITKEICEMGVREILISGGGEPLCTPNITIEIMNMVRDHDVEGRLITNGTLWARELIEDTIEMNWKHVIFSVDAPDAQTHDYLRGVKGAFKTTIKNIKLFKKLKEKRSRGVYEIPLLELTAVLNIHNFMKIIGLVKLAHNIGIKHINVEALCINNPAAEKNKLNDVERKKFLKTIIPKAKCLANSYGITTNFPKLTEAKFIEKTGNLKSIILESSCNSFVNLPCYEPWLWPKIEANGEVWPCSSVSLHENIKDKSFKEIWFGDKFQHFRRRVMEKNLPSECSNCVLTHIPRNREIKRKLRAVVVKNGRNNE